MSRILVVDDEKLIALMFRDTLAQEGHQVEIAYDGEEGLQKLRRQPYDLVISDLIMPVMDGIAMVGEMRRQFPGLAVLIITSITDSGPDYMALVESLPSVPVLKKPVDRTTLLAAVSELLSERA